MYVHRSGIIEFGAFLNRWSFSKPKTLFSELRNYFKHFLNSIKPTTSTTLAKHFQKPSLTSICAFIPTDQVHEILTKRFYMIPTFTELHIKSTETSHFPSFLSKTSVSYVFYTQKIDNAVWESSHCSKSDFCLGNIKSVSVDSESISNV